MEVNKAIRLLEASPDYFEIGEPVSFNNLMVIKKETAEIIALLKSLATRCQDYDALLDELKDYSQELVLVDDDETPIDFYNEIKNLPDTIKRLEQKYLRGGE